MKKYIYSKDEILSMSELRVNIAASLESKTKPIVKHLMKLRLYPNTEYVSHWRKEISNFLNEVPRLKPSNKYPSSDFIIDNTYEVNKSDFETWFNNIVDDYELEPAEISKEKLMKDIHDYFIWIAEELSKHGDVSRKSIVAKLQELNF